jgi:hypothetical protein
MKKMNLLVQSTKATPRIQVFTKSDLIFIISLLKNVLIQKMDIFLRIREFEEINSEQEKKIRFLYEEQTRLTEGLNKANATLLEESEANLIQ